MLQITGTESKVIHDLKYLLSENLDARLPLIKKQFQAHSTKNKPDFPTVAQDHDLAVYHDVGPIRVYSLESIDDLNTQLEKKIKVYNF
jgi:hypothetical protein